MPARPDVAAQLADWLAMRSGMSPARLEFMDAKPALAARVARPMRSAAGVGKRLRGPIPHGHLEQATSFVAGLTTRGFVIRYVVDHVTTGTIFSTPGSSRCWHQRRCRATSS